MSSRGQRTTLQRLKKKGDWPLAVHLSSINGVTEDRAPLPLQATVLPLASFSGTCQHFDSRLTLTVRPNPFWHSCHTIHLSSDFTVALHMRALPSKRKTRLMNEHHTLPSVWIWISISIQQVLNQFGRYIQSSVLYMICTTYFSDTVPAFYEHWAGVGRVLACGNFSELRLVYKKLVHSNTR